MEELFGRFYKKDQFDESLALITVKYFYEFGTYLLIIKDLEIKQGVLNSVVEQFFDSLFQKEEINISLYFYLAQYHYRYYKKTNRDLRFKLDRLENMVYSAELIESKFLIEDIKELLVHLYPSSKDLKAKLDLIKWPVLRSTDIVNDLGDESSFQRLKGFDPLIDKFLEHIKNIRTQDKKITDLGKTTKSLIQANKDLESFILTLGQENNIIN